MRVIADDGQTKRDGSSDAISFIAGTFNIEKMRTRLENEIQQLGGVDLVIIDTSAAYFPGNEELSNTQMGAYARMLRMLTTLPRGPCVLVLCHPIKHVETASQLLPRGGGAFLAEIDGNLTLWKSDGSLIELYHTKMRGPGFEPMTFRLETIECDALRATPSAAFTGYSWGCSRRSWPRENRMRCEGAGDWHELTSTPRTRQARPID